MVGITGHFERLLWKIMMSNRSMVYPWPCFAMFRVSKTILTGMKWQPLREIRWDNHPEMGLKSKESSDDVNNTGLIDWLR